MKKERCPICGAEIELREDEQLQSCAIISHGITKKREVKDE